jgi:putative endonuclease
MVGYMQVVYVLQSQKDGNLYVGCTADINERVLAHNGGKVRSTQARRPFVLIYQEGYDDKYEAFRMERFYKDSERKKRC